ncbi:hypothetical protein T484DRAFT_1788372 [Baffinella frigidus]|nr:hypothetical protein T484DRAFT_1788372 [Cryptophyta sp. CCMP2293]
MVGQFKKGKCISVKVLGCFTLPVLTCMTFFVDACGLQNIRDGSFSNRRVVKGSGITVEEEYEVQDVQLPLALQTVVASLMWVQMLQATIVSTPMAAFTYTTVSVAVVALLMWVQMLQATIVSTPMAAFTYTIGIMINDLSHSFLMIGILLMAFASALAILNEPPFNSFSESLLILLEEVLGVSTPSYTNTSWLTMSLVLTFVVMVIVGFLNILVNIPMALVLTFVVTVIVGFLILIAQLTITYDRLTKDKEGFALKHRAQVCLDIEDLLTITWRRKLFKDLGFHEKLPFGKDDLGPAGGIQVLEADSCERYNPDRVMRFTGSATVTDPWPIIEAGGALDEHEHG